MQHEFALFCRALRKRQGLSRKEFAAKAGLAERTVAYWESGEREPRIDELQRALQTLSASEVEQQRAYLLLTTQRGLDMVRHQAGIKKVAASDNAAMPDLGDLLRALRMRQGWSVSQLAGRMGVHYLTIGRWEQTEQLPNEEHLLRLCALLAAQPEERQTLLSRRLLPPAWPYPLTLDDCARMTDAFCREVTDLDNSLVDLHALSLKRAVYCAARSSSHFDLLMGRIESYHSKWLTMQNRIPEASVCVNRALRTMSISQRESRLVHATLNLAMLFTGFKQKNRLKVRCRLLDRWHDVVEREVQFLLCADMACYAALMGNLEEARRFVNQSRRLLAALPASEFRSSYYDTTYARVLFHLDRPHEALQAMPTELQDGRSTNLFRACLWAEMLVKAGERNEAQTRIDWLTTQLEFYPSRLLGQRINALTARL